jgi:hypothetical protein
VGNTLIKFFWYSTGFMELMYILTHDVILFLLSLKDCLVILVHISREQSADHPPPPLLLRSPRRQVEII